MPSAVIKQYSVAGSKQIQFTMFDQQTVRAGILLRTKNQKPMNL